MPITKFYGILKSDKSINYNNFDNKAIVEFLYSKSFFEKKGIEYKEKLCRLNRLWNGNQHTNREYMFASVIFSDDCYFLSDKYLDEATELIFKTAKRKSDIEFLRRKELYKIDNESFIDAESKKNFYKKELDQLIKNKKSLLLDFRGLVHKTETSEFNQALKSRIRKDLHSNTEFNSAYLIKLYDIEDIRILGNTRYDELFSINRKIELVKSELKQKNLNSAELETFTIQEAVCLLEIIGVIQIDSKTSHNKQAKFVSKLIGKNVDNIRRKMRLYDSKNPKDIERLNAIINNMKSELNEIDYKPLGY